LVMEGEGCNMKINDMSFVEVASGLYVTSELMKLPKLRNSLADCNEEGTGGYAGGYNFKLIVHYHSTEVCGENNDGTLMLTPGDINDSLGSIVHVSDQNIPSCLLVDSLFEFYGIEEKNAFKYKKVIGFLKRLDGLGLVQFKSLSVGMYLLNFSSDSMKCKKEAFVHYAELVDGLGVDMEFPIDNLKKKFYGSGTLLVIIDEN